jgi:hypothetical protein
VAKHKKEKHVDQYKIRRVGGLPKNLRGTTFTSYDSARIAVRSYLRARGATSTTLGIHGFSIQKIA